ncbi:MAG: hypothetical protein IKJ00_00455 [Clostridia bacterium]|nr:hypothetical protein [Clostridia bacterium]
MLKKPLNKKIIISLLAIIMLFSCSVNIFAALPTENEIIPLWDNIATVNIGIVFDGNDGVATVAARKSSNADLIEGTLYLYKWEDNDWQYVDAVYGSKSVGTLCLDIEFVGETGVEYKAVFIVTAHDGQYAETETFEHFKVC